MMYQSKRRLLAVFLATFLAACTEWPDPAPDARTAEPVVRDSVGVRIVENGAPLWGDAPAWTVEREPALTIGVVSGDPDYEFTRVVDAVRLADGRIVVADGPRLRFYDAAGRHLSSIGRQGEGPGEFRRDAGPLCVLPDGVLGVADYRHRYHIVSPDAGFTRTVRFADGISAEVLDCFGDAGWLGRTLVPGPSERDEHPERARYLLGVLREDLPLLEHIPAYQALHVDALGHIWAERFHRVVLQNYALPGARPGMHDVFDSDGLWLGTIELPLGLDVLEIGDDYVLGRDRDDLGVERVRLHGMTRG